MSWKVKSWTWLGKPLSLQRVVARAWWSGWLLFGCLTMLVQDLQGVDAYVSGVRKRWVPWYVGVLVYVPLGLWSLYSWRRCYDIARSVDVVATMAQGQEGGSDEKN